MRKHQSSKFMFMGILTLSLCFVFGPIISEVSATGKDKVVRISTLTDYSPYNFEKEDTKKKGVEIIPAGSDSSHFQGYSWDVVRESFQASGYEIELRVRPWARAMLEVEDGLADVIYPAVKTPERIAKFDFSNEYVHLTNVVVYSFKNSGIKWSGLDSLAGRKVGVILGWAYGKEWDSAQGIKKHEVSTIEQCFAIHDLNRVSAVVGYEIPFDYYLKKNDLAGKYQKSPPINSKPSFVMGSKSNPQTVILLKAFDEGKRKLEQNGKLEKILEKWQ